MKKLASLLLLLLFPLIMIAQGTGLPGPGPPPPPPGLPIDGGLLFLLIAGIVYGVKKLKN